MCHQSKSTISDFTLSTPINQHSRRAQTPHVPWFCQIQLGPRTTRIPGASIMCVCVSILCHPPHQAHHHRQRRLLLLQTLFPGNPLSKTHTDPLPDAAVHFTGLQFFFRRTICNGRESEKKKDAFSISAWIEKWGFVGWTITALEAIWFSRSFLAA